uniref:hypothetical protein n=1 Tax=Rhizobium sp. SGZ-381 TaxID=3342800 RepID=UPI00366AB50C
MTKSEETRGELPFHLDLRAQAALLADLPESVAREAGNFYEGCRSDLKSDSMQHAWQQVLRPYLIGLRDHSRLQARPVMSKTEAVGWWYEDKHGCIHMSIDMALGRRHEAENGAKLNLLYGEPLPGDAPTPSSHVVVSKGYALIPIKPTDEVIEAICQ